MSPTVCPLLKVETTPNLYFWKLMTHYPPTPQRPIWLNLLTPQSTSEHPTNVQSRMWYYRLKCPVLNYNGCKTFCISILMDFSQMFSTLHKKESQTLARSSFLFLPRVDTLVLVPTSLEEAPMRRQDRLSQHPTIKNNVKNIQKKWIFWYSQFLGGH